MDRKGRDVPPREFLPKMCNSTLIRRKPSIQIEGHSQYLDYQAMNVSITQDRKFQTDGQVQCVSLTWRKPCSKGDYWENVTTKLSELLPHAGGAGTEASRTMQKKVRDPRRHGPERLEIRGTLSAARGSAGSDTDTAQATILCHNWWLQIKARCMFSALLSQFCNISKQNVFGKGKRDYF